ncbi:MAG: DUF3549 family protein [Plesiomonas sp.]|uniref:DUF3549 family protein n=1 Tax=Plesiomonas sp. TaxID=2486279 RepID=UPI003F40FF05
MTAALTELLTFADVNATFYDLGRRPHPLALSTFSLLENQQRPYPYPLRGQARLALICTPHANLCLSSEKPASGDSQAKTTDTTEPCIWFLTLSLDENGMLIPEECARFARLLQRTLGNKLEKTPNEEDKKALAEHPQHWQPSPERMAMFHARLSYTHQQAPSRFYLPAQRYLSGEMGWQQWQDVGLQGLAEVITRDRTDQHQIMLCRAINAMPSVPLQALCLCLEQTEISAEVAEILFARLTRSATQDDQLLLLRALAYAPDSDEQQTFIQHQLQHDNADAWLIVLTARLPHRLNSPALLQPYLQALGNSSLFEQLYPEVITQPLLRQQIFTLLQQKQAPDSLVNALLKLHKKLH